MSYILVDNIHAKNPRLIVNSTKGNSWKLVFFFFFYLSYLGWEDPLEEGMAPPPVFWRILENPHGQRGRKEPDTTERLSTGSELGSEIGGNHHSTDYCVCGAVRVIRLR